MHRQDGRGYGPTRKGVAWWSQWEHSRGILHTLVEGVCGDCKKFALLAEQVRGGGSIIRQSCRTDMVAVGASLTWKNSGGRDEAVLCTTSIPQKTASECCCEARISAWLGPVAHPAAASRGSWRTWDEVYESGGFGGACEIGRLGGKTYRGLLDKSGIIQVRKVSQGWGWYMLCVACLGALAGALLVESRPRPACAATSMRWARSWVHTWQAACQPTKLKCASGGIMPTVVCPQSTRAHAGQCMARHTGSAVVERSASFYQSGRPGRQHRPTANSTQGAGRTLTLIGAPKCLAAAPEHRHPAATGTTYREPYALPVECTAVRLGGRHSAAPKYPTAPQNSTVRTPEHGYRTPEQPDRTPERGD